MGAGSEPSTCFYISAHGLHDSNFIRFGDGRDDIVYPTDDLRDLSDPNGLSQHDWYDDKLNTVIFAACSVIDCGNWNNGEHGKYFNNNNPGLSWALIVKPSTLLLGFNAQAPDAEETTAAIERRDTRIVNLFYEQIAKGDHPTLAWLRGNARMETRLVLGQN